MTHAFREGGIYVHFPYCRHRCHYCDFALVTPETVPEDAYTQAVQEELVLRAGALPGPAQSLYIGGGTPSLWAPERVGAVLATARAHHRLLDDAEITLEANPEDLDEELANAYVAQGVNRFSVGVQALLDERLTLLDRGHDAARGRESVRAAAATGASVSLDLIFGTPGQTEASWRAELTDAVALGADHVSIYDLTVEPRTRLDRMIRDGAYGPLDDGLSARLFDLTREALSAAGFVHYEVSSYARPGHEARHNRGYWHGLPYLGIGAAAHGLLARRRWVNVRRPAAYMEAVGRGEPEASSEHLDGPTWVWERVLTGLRDLQLGVEASTIEALESPAYDSLLERGYLERSGARVRVAHDRVPLLDSVLLELAPDVL